MEVTGILKVKNDTQVVSAKFKKREFVLMTDGSTNYPQYVTFVLTQDKVDLLDRFKIGEVYTVKFNLKGREHNGKYFNTLEAWSISLPSID